MVSAYLASPYRYGSLLDVDIAPRLLSAGVRVVSSWHIGHRGQAEGPCSTEARRDILVANLLDLDRADVMIAYEADRSGRELFVELGRALERAAPIAIYYVPHDPAAPFLSSCDARVTICDSLDAAVDAVARLAAASACVAPTRLADIIAGELAGHADRKNSNADTEPTAPAL